jgi:hypothetical protein
MHRRGQMQAGGLPDTHSMPSHGGNPMTRTHLKSLLVALSLTALAAAPARSDSLSKLGKSPKKDAAENENVVVARYSSDDDDCDDDDGDDGSGSRLHRLRNRLRSHRSAGDAVYLDGPACYPQLNSSLYPCPKQNVPVEVGQTFITNQAFYPHEMLYAHQYRALYPPFFYENKCGLTSVPFFPKPCLRGTLVTVKYKTTYPCGFFPPWRATKTCFSNTQFR